MTDFIHRKSGKHFLIKSEIFTNAPFLSTFSQKNPQNGHNGPFLATFSLFPCWTLFCFMGRKPFFPTIFSDRNHSWKSYSILKKKYPQVVPRSKSRFPRFSTIFKSPKNVDKNGHFVNIFPVLWPFLAFLWPFLDFLWILFSTYMFSFVLQHQYNSFTKIILKKLKIYKIFTIFTIFTKKKSPKKSKARVKFSKKKSEKNYFFLFCKIICFTHVGGKKSVNSVNIVNIFLSF